MAPTPKPSGRPSFDAYAGRISRSRRGAEAGARRRAARTAGTATSRPGRPATKVSTRKAGGAVISAFFPKVPTFIGGSADLDPSTQTGHERRRRFRAIRTSSRTRRSRAPSVAPGATPAAISTSASASMPWAAPSTAWPPTAVSHSGRHSSSSPTTCARPSASPRSPSYKSIFVFTHDSIAVGEDGPTHEPVEQIMSLRLIPKLTVIRPGDANETADAWRVALQHHGPTCLVLSRQDLPVLDTSGAKGSLANGAYILRDSDGEPDIVLIGTGSEVQLAVGAADELAEQGVRARVVSMPSWELFDEQSDEYRQSVLGGNGVRRVSVEAGTTIGWQRYADCQCRDRSIRCIRTRRQGARIFRFHRRQRGRARAEAARQASNARSIHRGTSKG